MFHKLLSSNHFYLLNYISNNILKFLNSIYTIPSVLFQWYIDKFDIAINHDLHNLPIANFFIILLLIYDSRIESRLNSNTAVFNFIYFEIKSRCKNRAINRERWNYRLNVVIFHNLLLSIPFWLKKKLSVRVQWSLENPLTWRSLGSTDPDERERQSCHENVSHKVSSNSYQISHL